MWQGGDLKNLQSVLDKVVTQVIDFGKCAHDGIKEILP